AELQSAQARQRHEQSKPKREHRPERKRRPAKNAPEKCKVRRINRVANGQPEIKRLARRGRGGELKQKEKKNDNEKSKRRKSVGQMKRGHRADGQEQRPSPGQRLSWNDRVVPARTRFRGERRVCLGIHDSVRQTVTGDFLGIGANAREFADQLMRAGDRERSPDLLRRRVVPRQNLLNESLAGGRQP